MNKQEFIVKIDNNRVFFNSDLSISFEETNLPFNEYLKFKPKIYWRVKLLEFSTLNNELKVEVLDYNNKDIERFENQKAKNSPPKLIFKLPFDWNSIYEISYLNQKNKLVEFGFIIDQPLKSNYKTQNRTINNFDHKNTSIKSNQKEQKKTFSVKVPFNNTVFKLGRIAFNGRLSGINEELFFDVENEHIIEKFEFIKSWFVRKLKINSWKVDITIIFIGNEIINIKAISADVSKITPELIEGIKYDRTVNLLNNTSIEDSIQGLFSVNEIFSQNNLEKKAKNLFEQSERDILKILLSKKGRNRKQLEYLSEEKQSLEYSLKFTLNPHFGFLFTVESKENNHFVWELLETHATYIWSINKSVYEIEKQLKQVEKEISIITKFGREKYRKSFQKDQEFTFEHINHDGIVLNQETHFVQWKNKLEKYLEK